MSHLSRVQNPTLAMLLHFYLKAMMMKLKEIDSSLNQVVRKKIGLIWSASTTQERKLGCSRCSKKFFLQKANPLYRENVQMTAEGTNKEQEYRKLVQALHAMAASDKYFGKPQPPLGGYHWFMRVVERSDWKVEEHHMPLLERLHGEIVYDYRRSMGLASIFYQILSEDKAGHFDLNPQF